MVAGELNLVGMLKCSYICVKVVAVWLFMSKKQEGRVIKLKDRLPLGWYPTRASFRHDMHIAAKKNCYVFVLIFPNDTAELIYMDRDGDYVEYDRIDHSAPSSFHTCEEAAAWVDYNVK